MRQKIILALGYLTFFLFAFLFSLYLTFNPAQVKLWLETKANEKGFNLTIGELKKYRLSGVLAREISLQTKTGKNIKIDRLKARLALIPLFLGKKEISFQLSLYGGNLSGKMEQTRRGYKAEFKAQNINLATMQAGSTGGFWIASKFSGRGNLDLTPRDNPKNWSGKIEMELGDGIIPSFNYQGFQVPEIKIEQGKLELELANGIAEIKRLDLLSPDFPFQGKGQMELRQPFVNSQLQLEAKVNPAPQFLEQIKMLEALLPANRIITYRGSLAGLAQRPNQP